ncbi:Teneurin-4 [Manis pentadactyla]|nr:Teneurin-4 [Manis pentadactyla]
MPRARGVGQAQRAASGRGSSRWALPLALNASRRGAAGLKDPGRGLAGTREEKQRDVFPESGSWSNWFSIPAMTWELGAAWRGRSSPCQGLGNPE